MSPSIVSIITIQTAESELLGVSNIKEWSLAPTGGGGGRGKTGGDRREKATAILVKLCYRLIDSDFTDQILCDSGRWGISTKLVNFIYKDLHDQLTFYVFCVQMKVKIFNW